MDSLDHRACKDCTDYNPDCKGYSMDYMEHSKGYMVCSKNCMDYNRGMEHKNFRTGYIVEHMDCTAVVLVDRDYIAGDTVGGMDCMDYKADKDLHQLA